MSAGAWVTVGIWTALALIWIVIGVHWVAVRLERKRDRLHRTEFYDFHGWKVERQYAPYFENREKFQEHMSDGRGEWVIVGPTTDYTAARLRWDSIHVQC